MHRRARSSISERTAPPPQPVKQGSPTHQMDAKLHEAVVGLPGHSLSACLDPPYRSTTIPSHEPDPSARPRGRRWRAYRLPASLDDGLDEAKTVPSPCVVQDARAQRAGS